MRREEERENRDSIMVEMDFGKEERVEMVDCTSDDLKEEEEGEGDLFRGIDDVKMDDIADIDESQIQGMAVDIGKEMLAVEQGGRGGGQAGG